MTLAAGRPAPWLVMVAGPNGSGKSTLIAKLRQALPDGVPQLYVNADDLQRRHHLDVHEAQQQAQSLRDAAIAQGDDLMFETVMSHPSKVAELQRARLHGYRVVVHLVATQDADINVHRVALRVAAGGHDVPPERTRARYHRTLHLSPMALSLADEAYLWDNSDDMTLQAVWQGQHAQVIARQVAPWAQTLLRELHARAQIASRIASTPPVLGTPLQAADIEQGSTVGPIIAATPCYLLQWDPAEQRHILHDVALFDTPLPVSPQAVRLSYLHGVLATADVTPTADHAPQA